VRKALSRLSPSTQVGALLSGPGDPRRPKVCLWVTGRCECVSLVPDQILDRRDELGEHLKRSIDPGLRGMLLIPWLRPRRLDGTGPKARGGDSIASWHEPNSTRDSIGPDLSDGSEFPAMNTCCVPPSVGRLR
jgi:hypothetical protein